MTQATVHVESVGCVEVRTKDVLDELDYSDLREYLKGLSSEEKSDFAAFLPECYEDVPLFLPMSELLGKDLALDMALDTIIEEYQASPYLRDKIRDRLSLAKIV